MSGLFLRKRDKLTYHIEIAKRSPDAKELSVRVEGKWGGRVQYITMLEFREQFTNVDGSAIQ